MLSIFLPSLLHFCHVLRPIYTEELPGAAAHDSFFVLLCREILRSCTARQLLGAIRQTKNRARLLLATPRCRLAFTVTLHYRWRSNRFQI